MKSVHMVAFVLVIIGGLNWGLMGLGAFMSSDWNVVHMLLRSMPTLEAVIYILVGLSALTLAFTHRYDCRYCAPSSSNTSSAM